jgi:hypothetical protein
MLSSWPSHVHGVELCRRHNEGREEIRCIDLVAHFQHLRVFPGHHYLLTSQSVLSGPQVFGWGGPGAGWVSWIVTER